VNNGVIKCNLSVECRKASEVFCQGPSGRHYGLFVDFRIGGDSPIDFFAKLFWIKKRVFVLLFTKSSITYTNNPYMFLRKIPNGNFPFLMRIVFTLRNFYL